MPEIGLAGRLLIGAERRQHIERDRLDGGTGIAAVAALAADAGRDLEGIEIDAHDRVDRVDQRQRIAPPARAARAGRTTFVMLGVSLTITGRLRGS